MKANQPIAALYAALAFHTAMAMVDPPNNTLGPCHEETCNNCGGTAYELGAGYPQCLVYQSSGLGSAFESSSGNGYDVWWSSGPPKPMCRIVVRTPASQEMSNCGYYLTSWSEAGCYYTPLQSSFQLSFCCGSGDCEGATLAADMDDAVAQAAAGNTTWLSIDLGEEFRAGATSGANSIEDIGEMVWKRSDYAYTKREEISQKESVVKRNVVEEPKTVRRDGCTFTPQSDKVTVAGPQTQVSSTQVCNTAGGCSISVATTLTEGRTITPTINIRENVWGAISASVSESFMTSESYAVTTLYDQKEGTTGYVSFIPTMDCYKGTFSDCYAKNGDDIFLIDSSTVYDACRPESLAEAGGEEAIGTFSFVYVNP